ncbi:hypothetical protein [Humisphaera borealis]|uniref:Uncharacterized protein n=1 Tax=Humisphaera borealis TaxID=2807512 RepID=A0A7M2WWP3_9BACT|nr:hypothetical protein [Humisphaera borealis]QOV89915.1 hypothetical protein IPV69_00650 [Humisphaera borealis]
MSEAGIELSRTPYEEPYHLCLLIRASNGRLRGELEYYCNASDIQELGSQLRRYSGDREKEIVYELGSEKPEDRFAFFLSLRVKAINLRGHCCVSVRLNNNDSRPDREITEFSIPAEVADVNRLGDLLTGFGQLRHRRLIWHVTTGELLEDGDVAG